jgi:hypothetical protein
MKQVSLRTLCLFLSLAAAGRAQSPDVNQLKDQVRQLEQMVQDLKQRITDIENNQRTPGMPLVQPGQPPAQTTSPKVPPPQIPTNHISELTRERVVANDDPSTAARIDNEEIDPSLRGFFRLPGTGTLIKLNGFVKTDLFVDTNMAGSYYGAYVPSSFPSSPQPHTVNSTVSMRPSRFSVEFRQPVGDATDSNDYVKA